MMKNIRITRKREREKKQTTDVFFLIPNTVVMIFVLGVKAKKN